METPRGLWKLTAFVLALLTLGILVIGLPAYATESPFPMPPIPIPTQPGRFVEPFIGAAATPNPIEAPAIPANPFMDTMKINSSNIQSWSALHDDPYMSDTYFEAGATGGPLGKSPIVSSTWLGLDKDSPMGLALGITFDSDKRLVVGVVTSDLATGQAWLRLRLIDPADLATLAWLDLPKQTLLGGTWRPAGVYFYQDQLGRVVAGTPERTVWIVSHSCDPAGSRNCDFKKERVYSLNGANGIPEGDDIEALQPDYSGRLWFTSKGGVVGVLDLDSGEVVARVALSPERIVNGTAADETGGIYIATTAAMYRFDWDTVKGKPGWTWRETYDAGTHTRAGQVDIGTGTTPTLMGKDYVAITDNAQPRMNVVVWRRTAKVQGSRLVCAVPVFQPGPTSNENSLVATDKSIVVENNFGYKGPKSTTHGQTTKAGLARIDIDADGKGCHTVWTSTQESIPSVVTKMSLQNGLIYTYTKPKGPADTDPWYFTAISFETGKTVYKQLAGTGVLYDNDYAPVFLGPDGTFYVGVVGGMVAMRDGQ